MKVKLISKTPNMLDVVYTGARTCYNAGSPIDMWNDVHCYGEAHDKKIKLINKVFESGHLSTSEHAYFTFAIEGISRACSHQLVRHRHCSFSQQSQRYVEIKENHGELYDLLHGFATDEKIAKMKKIAEKYFVDVTDDNYYGYIHCLWQYTLRVSNGEPSEDSRNSLPNATKTNIVVSMNLRELIHLCNERLCTRAQGEIRQLVKEMVKEVVKGEEWLKPYLVAKCEQHGICFEHKSCGRKPTLEEFKTRL